MLKLVQKIKALLTKDERKEMAWLLISMFLLGIVEFIGVGSILPFMKIVADQDVIHQNHFLESVYLFLQFEDERAFLLFAGVIVLLLIILNNIFITFVNWRIFHFTWMRNASISTRLFTHYLKKKYEFFLNVNTSDLEKNLFEEVRLVITGILNPVLMLTKNIITICSVFILLVFMDPFLAISTIAGLGGAYVLLFTIISRYLEKIGETRALANKQRFKIADEALKGIKELNVLGRKDYFIEFFKKHSIDMSLSQANKSVVSKLPKHAFEVFAFGGILLIILYFLARDYELSTTIPILSLYTFAGYRLLPALQTVFTGISEIRYSKAALDNLMVHTTKFEEDTVDAREGSGFVNMARFGEVTNIEVKNICYAYPGQSTNVLKDVSFDVAQNRTVGIIGSTGSGKTTLVDILLGLLQAQTGALMVNGITLDEDLMPEWRSRVGYVPQDIYLLDDSVTQNIAYGVLAKEVDVAAVVRAAEQAKIHETIIEELDDGYDTVVGERGVKLSGGQRQRIGIARALYHDPDVIFFDEGTSALDNLTEKQLMSEIQSLSSRKTIFMIAHRLSTLRFCDLIICLDHGVIVDSGSYKDISGRSELFLGSEGHG